MTAPANRSMTAISPLYSPLPVIRTRSPMARSVRPWRAAVLISATVGRTYGSGAVTPGLGGWRLAVDGLALRAWHVGEWSSLVGGGPGRIAATIIRWGSIRAQRWA